MSKGQRSQGKVLIDGIEGGVPALAGAPHKDVGTLQELDSGRDEGRVRETAGRALLGLGRDGERGHYGTV